MLEAAADILQAHARKWTMPDSPERERAMAWAHSIREHAHSRRPDPQALASAASACREAADLEPIGATTLRAAARTLESALSTRD